MSSSVELDVLYRVGNTPVRTYPFPHFYVPEVFPAPYYAELQRNLPKPEQMKPLESRGTRGYPERSVLELTGERPEGMPEGQFAFWQGLRSWLLGGRFGHLILQKFAPVVEPRLRDQPDMLIIDEALLVHDRTRYALGPHTDSPRKVVSVLFYLPADERLARHGTSIYVPKEAGFTCLGNAHHPFANFDRMATMPFVPNSMFAFAKTDNSFHGVEPFDVPDAARWLLLFDLQLRQDPAAAAAAPPAPAPGQPAVQFKF
ncbi:MAG TPA: hypothetical protein VG873_02920 [Burkholderiales bacterium]|nr:hypothetical protein [Burkholderiales bacterium]